MRVTSHHSYIHIMCSSQTSKYPTLARAQAIRRWRTRVQHIQ